MSDGAGTVVPDVEQRAVYGKVDKTMQRLPLTGHQQPLFGGVYEGRKGTWYKSNVICRCDNAVPSPDRSPTTAVWSSL